MDYKLTIDNVLYHTEDIFKRVVSTFVCQVYSNRLSAWVLHLAFISPLHVSGFAREFKKS